MSLKTNILMKVLEFSWGRLSREAVSLKIFFSIQVHGTGGKHGGDPHPGGPTAGHGQPRGGGSPAGTSYFCCCCCVLVSDWSCTAVSWCLIGHMLVYANVWLVMCCCSMFLTGHMLVCATVWLVICCSALMSDWSHSCVYWCLIGHVSLCTDVWLISCW